MMLRLNDLRVIELEQAKILDPWQLITQPTLIKDSVAPSNSKIALIGLIFGSIIGTITSFFRERNSNKVFDLSILEQYLSSKCIEKIKYSDIQLESEKIRFVRQYIYNKPDINVCLFLLGDIEIENIKNIQKLFKNDNKKNIRISFLTSLDDLIFLENSSLKIFITELGKIKYTELKNIKKRLTILNQKFTNIILFSST